MTSSEDPRPTSSDLRWFGVVLAGVFAVVGFIVGWQFGAIRLRLVLWGTGVVLALLYYGVSSLRVPFYLVWMAIFAPVGRVISIGLLGFVYFGVLTPIAMLMSIFGRDRLGRRFDPERATYWMPLDSSGDASKDVDRYFRQT